MIDTARVNARTVAKLQGDGPYPDSAEFGFKLARELITPLILRRRTSPGVQNFIKIHIESYLKAGEYRLKRLYYENG
jgi:hypothetical protein